MHCLLQVVLFVWRLGEERMWYDVHLHRTTKDIGHQTSMLHDNPNLSLRLTYRPRKLTRLENWHYVVRLPCV